MRGTWTFHLAVTCVAAGTLGCDVIAGIDGDFSTAPAIGNGGGSGASSGASAGHGGTSCPSGEVESCYSGEPGTDGKGLCVAGLRLCQMDGSGWGPCEGEVTPTEETCLTPGDDDCDELINEEGEGCVCVPEEFQPCYSGPLLTKDVGLCHGGQRKCDASGMGFGPCIGEVTPTNETCNTPEDDDCDGKTNESGEACICVPNEVVVCYTGLPGSAGKGICKSGEKMCDASGLSFGPCVGEVTPSAEQCGTILDEDCGDLIPDIDSGCGCLPGEVVDCYSGPPGTAMVGLCHVGHKTCDMNGLAYGPCMDEVTPSAELCNTIEDEDCDGLVPDTDSGCACSPGSTSGCYTGPPGTELKGLCHGGQKTCAASGLAFGSCEGEVKPASEMCSTAEDEDCDGLSPDTDSGCLCVPGDSTACYTGGLGTKDIGVCHGGQKTCATSGTLYGACVGEITPTSEVCSTAVDEDCDGTSLDEDVGCVCSPGTMATCYTGPVNTAGVGACKTGIKTCNAQGTGYGACSGQVVPSAENCATSMIDEDCNGDKSPCSGAKIWARGFGDAGAQNGAAIALDPQGDVVITGDLAGTVSFGGPMPLVAAGGSDIYLVKLDHSLGNYLFQKHAGGVGDEQGMGVAVDSAGNMVITGQFTSQFDLGCGASSSVQSFDAMGAKLGSSGTCAWSKAFGGTGNQVGNDIAIDAAASVFIVGSFGNNINFGPGAKSSQGGTDAFLVKFSPAGGYLWDKTFGDGFDQFGTSVAVDLYGNVFVAGYFQNTITIGPTLHTSAGGTDISVSKFTTDGIYVWSQRLGGSGNEQVKSVAVSDSGNVALIGSMTGSVDLGNGVQVTNAGVVDVLVAELNADGTSLWAKSFGSAGNSQTGNGVDIDSNGHVVITGAFAGNVDFGGGMLSSSGGNDVFVVKMDDLGNHLWGKRYGDANTSQAGNGIIVTDSGAPFVIGKYSGTLNVDGTFITSSGGGDVFVLSLQP